MTQNRVPLTMLRSSPRSAIGHAIVVIVMAMLLRSNSIHYAVTGLKIDNQLVASPNGKWWHRTKWQPPLCAHWRRTTARQTYCASIDCAQITDFRPSDRRLI